MDVDKKNHILGIFYSTFFFFFFVTALSGLANSAAAGMFIII